MREVDEALARVYAQRAREEHPRVPPAPHIVTPPGAMLEWPSLVLNLEEHYGDRFRTLAEALLENRARSGHKVLLFTSCQRAEGRTTLLLTLARALARHPGRTLLIDADLSGPTLAHQLGLRPNSGLDDVVEHGQALADALIESPEDNLTLLPLRLPVASARSFLTSPAWVCLLAKVRREFDLILLDGGPMFVGLSAAIMHRSVDAAILVFNRSLTGERALARAREVLIAGGIPLLGLAETFAP
jgi:protein-tyrosine kinase